jgi:hypothetical protein
VQKVRAFRAGASRDKWEGEREAVDRRIGHEGNCVDSD